MRFSPVVLLAILTPALAAPLLARAAARSFAELSISGGKAGTAKAEADAVFAAPADLASVTADELDTIQTERETAEAAEVDAFNPAIEAAGKDTAAGEALQRGKIKNKVLKLTGEVLALQIQAAQGADNADKIAAEQKKLDNNIKLDTAEAGQASTDIAFTG